MSDIIKHLCLLIFLIYSFALSGQDLKADLSRELNKLRNDRFKAINTRVLLEYNNKDLLDSLKKFDTDSIERIRFNVQILEFQIALNNPSDTAIKNEVIQRLINGIKDPVALIRQNSIKKLQTFSYLDFNTRAIKSLNEILDKTELNRDLILLIGVANIKERKDYLQSQVELYPINKLKDFYSLNWAMNLALARMGNSENINYCIENVDNFKDTISRITILLYDVSYIRRDAALVYLKKYLYDDNRLPSVENILMGSKYCQFALDAIANMIEDFPIKAQGIGYSDEEINVARKWMESHNQYKIIR